MEHDIGQGDSVGQKDFMLQEHPFLKHEFGNLDDNYLPFTYDVMVETTVCSPTFFLFLITHS